MDVRDEERQLCVVARVPGLLPHVVGVLSVGQVP